MKANQTKSKKVLAITFAIGALGFYAISSPDARAGVAQRSEESDRAAQAASVLGEIMDAPDQAIPEDLLDRAVGIAVIPHVVKGAFGFGGRYGKGWSPSAMRTAVGVAPFRRDRRGELRLSDRSGSDRRRHGVHQQ